MKDTIKKLIKGNILGTYLLQVYRTFKYYNHTRVSKLKKGTFLLKLFIKVRVYKNKSKGKAIDKLLKKTTIKVDNDQSFIYHLDYYKSTSDSDYKISNTSIDYGKVIEFNIEDYKKQYDKIKETTFGINELDLLNGLENYIDRLTKNIQESSKVEKEKYIQYIQNIKNKKCTSFEEGLQKILFFNQILWQTSHRLNGFGRLDKILGELYNNDIEKNIITREKAKEKLKEFLVILHKDFWFKSNDLVGDTGQIIILGGKEKDGSYFSNDLTYLWIEALKEIKLPDPKILLRTSSDMPQDLLKLACECIATGIGCPLLANDEVVIPKLIQFGYGEDSYNYVTSACWEPLIVGKDIGQNNITYINFLQPLEELLEKENLELYESYEILIKKYEHYLKEYLKTITDKLNEIKWERDPVISLFTEKCFEEQKDISEGGAIYNHYGVTGVAISNTVNSLLTIKELVYEQKKYTLQELRDLKDKNFEGNENLSTLKNEFGEDCQDVIDLTNQIMCHASEALQDYQNPLGGRIKFGFSAPSYIIASKNFPASLDGRKANQPFGVHISSRKSIPYTELFQFAGKLDYNQNRINGNVVDFVISPNFLLDNIEKFTDFLRTSMKIGFYEMQMNVVSSATLIEARKNPEQFPNLIVRVWGFSTYFKELPDEYKDYIIERTIQSERAS